MSDFAVEETLEDDNNEAKQYKVSSPPYMTQADIIGWQEKASFSLQKLFQKDLDPIFEEASSADSSPEFDLSITDNNLKPNFRVQIHTRRKRALATVVSTTNGISPNAATTLAMQHNRARRLRTAKYAKNFDTTTPSSKDNTIERIMLQSIEKADPLVSEEASNFTYQSSPLSTKHGTANKENLSNSSENQILAELQACTTETGHSVIPKNMQSIFDAVKEPARKPFGSIVSRINIANSPSKAVDKSLFESSHKVDTSRVLSNLANHDGCPNMPNTITKAEVSSLSTLVVPDRTSSEAQPLSASIGNFSQIYRAPAASVPSSRPPLHQKYNKHSVSNISYAFKSEQNCYMNLPSMPNNTLRQHYSSHQPQNHVENSRTFAPKSQSDVTIDTLRPSHPHSDTLKANLNCESSTVSVSEVTKPGHSRALTKNRKFDNRDIIGNHTPYFGKINSDISVPINRSMIPLPTTKAKLVIEQSSSNTNYQVPKESVNQVQHQPQSTFCIINQVEKCDDPFGEFEMDDSIFDAIDAIAYKHSQSDDLNGAQNSNLENEQQTIVEADGRLATNHTFQLTSFENRDPFGDFPEVNFEELDKMVEQHSQELPDLSEIKLTSCFQPLNISVRTPVANPMNSPNAPSDGSLFLCYSRYSVVHVNDEPRSFSKTLHVVPFVEDDEKDYQQKIQSIPAYMTKQLLLRGEWYFNLVEPGDTIQIVSMSGKWKTDFDSLPITLHSQPPPGSIEDDLLLVVDPDMLLGPSVVSEALECGRRGVLRNKIGSGLFKSKFF